MSRPSLDELIDKATRSQKQSSVYLGVDPGISGGAAILLQLSGASTILLETTPWGGMTLSQVYDYFSRTIGKRNVFATLERVGGFVGGGEGEKGGGQANGSAMFKFGQSYGQLEMALVASGIPHETVHPASWQKALGLHRAKMTRTEWKRRLKAEAEKLFPGRSITLATADAVLIAEYGRRKRTNTL